MDRYYVCLQLVEPNSLHKPKARAAMAEKLPEAPPGTQWRHITPCGPAFRFRGVAGAEEYLRSCDAGDPIEPDFIVPYLKEEGQVKTNPDYLSSPVELAIFIRLS